MNYPEVDYLIHVGLPEPIADAAISYLQTGDPTIAHRVTLARDIWQATFVGAGLVGTLPWNEATRKLLGFFIGISDGNSSPDDSHHHYLAGAVWRLLGDDSPVAQDTADEIVREIETRHQRLDSFMDHVLARRSYSYNWTLADQPSAAGPFISAAANFIFRFVTRPEFTKLEILTPHPELFAGLAVQAPDRARQWCIQSAKFDHWYRNAAWFAILNATDQFDGICLSLCETAPADQADKTFPLLYNLNKKRGNIHLTRLLSIAALPKAALCNEALELLIQHREPGVMTIMADAFALADAGDYISSIATPEYALVLSWIPSRWDAGGRELLSNLIANLRNRSCVKVLSDLLPQLEAHHLPVLREGIHRQLERLTPRDRPDFWKVVATTYPESCIHDFEQMLIGKSKPLREIAAEALARVKGMAALDQFAELLSSKKSDERLGAATLVRVVASPESLPVLQNALASEQSDAVRDALHEAFKACGGALQPTVAAASPASVIQEVAIRQSKNLKLPNVSWLAPALAFPLVTVDGQPLSEMAVAFLVAKQSKHKTIEAAPDILPLLAHLDRDRSAPFALALVEGFLNSEQAAGDRWALALGGLLGDNRLIPPLLSRIPDWCDNSRHKLAEYAAQTIALLPGNEPLMVLDTLANRYRNKYKNVGKACAAAFQAAATARGITPAELGDLVVPTFEFDDEGLRTFAWDGGSVAAELGPDFKLSWFDPASDRTWQSLPAAAPAAVKDEVKLLGKLLREAVKAQTARLELALVLQRRWPVARWRELYEAHPLLRGFASGLVWGVYDAAGVLLRTFRRYHNGILADAQGNEEELLETDTQIGMVHPLELDEAARQAWQAHLGRLKVKQPFPQLERPVELLDPLLANRREIAITRDKKLSAGTFRSRAEKRGWFRGSVVDAGGISSYVKTYPAVDVEVILPLDNFYIGVDPMDTIELSAAYFVRAETVRRGSYTYDEPGPDDPRVLKFAEVPAVVYSETISDLKAIVATKENPDP